MDRYLHSEAHYHWGNWRKCQIHPKGQFPFGGQWVPIVCNDEIKIAKAHAHIHHRVLGNMMEATWENGWRAARTLILEHLGWNMIRRTTWKSTSADPKLAGCFCTERSAGHSALASAVVIMNLHGMWLPPHWQGIAQGNNFAGVLQSRESVRIEMHDWFCWLPLSNQIFFCSIGFHLRNPKMISLEHCKHWLHVQEDGSGLFSDWKRRSAFIQWPSIMQVIDRT